MPDLARVDFRLGALTGNGGFDSISGSGVAITETDTGVGVYAADWTSDASNYGVKAITASDEVFTYLYLILDSAPASDLTILQILNNGTVVGEIDINSSRELELKNNGTQKGSASSALTLGTLYRIGLRQKKGTGANGELQGYVAEGHAELASFASSTTESFTTQADEIRAGAIDAVALDGRIGYLAADSRRMPGSWLKIHDYLVGPYGFMKNPKSGFQIADQLPANARSAIGESRADTFQTESFVSIASAAGGVGQSRMVAQDQMLTGIADTRFPGYIFPPRAAQAESDGGSTAWFFNRGATLYGVTATNFEEIGTATQTAHGGMPAHQPVVDGNNNVYWATTSQGLRKWDGSSVTSILPSELTRAYHAAAYGSHIWAFGELDIPADAYSSQSGGVGSISTSFTRSQSAPTANTYTLTLVAITIESATEADANSLALTSASALDWTLGLEDAVDDGASTYLRTLVYYRFGGGSESASISLTRDDKYDSVSVQFINIVGIDPDAEMVFESASDSGTSTGLTLTASSGADFQVSGVASSANDAITDPTSWTLINHINGDAPGTNHDVEFAYFDGQDTSVNWSGMTLGAYKIAWNVNLQEAPNAGQTQFRILASDDAGLTWTAAPSNFTSDLFGTIRASEAAAGALWLVTDRGLFRMVGQVNDTAGGTSIADVGVTRHDKWEVPADDNAGKWIASFQGLLYYPVGATVRRYAPNSSDPNDDRAFWPPPDWATKADQVQALVSNEGGIWFGAAGYLWNFNGRGFHQMAAEPEANAFDYLFWHQGKLYYKDDPAGYYEYDYVTVRPDILIANGDLTASDFTTGYLITPSLDFEKAADPKVIRLLESQVNFTAQDANSGSVAWDYRNGCSTLADPGVGSGGDTGSTWTSWGTHGYADGGYERHILTTPLQCYRLFVRATLTPGSSGIPVIHYFTVWGQSIMPSVDAVALPIQLNVNQKDRENSEMWGTAEQVKKMERVLRALRKRNDPSENLYLTVYINDGTDGGDEMLCTWRSYERTVSEESEDGQRLTIEVVAQFDELPGG